MTKERLEQYESIKEEIKELKAEIDRRKNMLLTDTVSGSSSDFPYTKHTITIKGLEYGIDLYSKRLDAKIKELDEERLEVEKWLGAVEDSLIRRIIRFKYIEGKTWQEVAFKIGKYDEQYPRKKLSNYLKSTKSTK